MSFLSRLGMPEPAVALGGGALLLLILWFGWRKPTWLFMIALASLAIRPELLWGGPPVSYDWGLHQTLIVFALAMNALRYGVRTTINWPVLALLATLVLSLAFGDPYPKLTLPLMLESLAVLALPFAFPQVVLEPGSRRALALTIALAPLLSVALGALLQLLGVWVVFSYERWVDKLYRLAGAIGDASTFAALAFAGFVVALHEATRPGRRYAILLAVINLILVIFSGARTAIVSTMFFAGVYGLMSDDLRKLYRRRQRALLAGAAAVIIALVAYLPTLRWRTFDGKFSKVQLSARDEFWSFFLREWSHSRFFGRGFGTGFLAGQDWLTDQPLPTPHNEYLHLLVIGGLIGFVLLAGGVFLWYRQLVERASANDRIFLLALAPTLVMYAITGDIWSCWSALALYAYLGTTLTSPSSLIMSDSSQARPPARRDCLLQDLG